MPIFDKRCNFCGHTVLDTYEATNAPKVSCPQRTSYEYYNDEDGTPITGSMACGGTLERTWLGKAASVIGDEIDVEIKHGLCWPDGTPRRFRSRSELKRVERQSGWSNHVVHIGERGSDKSPHTSRWV